MVIYRLSEHPMLKSDVKSDCKVSTANGGQLG